MKRVCEAWEVGRRLGGWGSDSFEKQMGGTWNSVECDMKMNGREVAHNEDTV